MKTATTLTALLLTGCYAIHTPTIPQYDKYGKEITFLEETGNPHGASAKYTEIL